MARRIRPVVGKIDLSGRDDQAAHDVAAILAELPLDHPARQALAEGKETVALTRLLPERPDLVERPKETVLATFSRGHRGGS